MVLSGGKVKRYQYKDYDHYIKSQRAGYDRKKTRCWANEENIAAICDFLKLRAENSGTNGERYKAEYGLCHGTRAGYEQKWFKRHLKKCASVIGTEIGDSDAEDTYQRDFNNEYSDFLAVFDFLYSNAFDHAFSPDKTISVWARQVKIGGVVIIEWDERNEHTGKVDGTISKRDPLSMTLAELETNIPQWCPELYHIATIDMPVVTFGYRKAVVFERVEI